MIKIKTDTRIECMKPRCLLCKDAKTCFFYSEINLNLYQCQRCNLVFVHPLPARGIYEKNLEINYIELANKYSKNTSLNMKNERKKIKIRKIWERQKRNIFRRDINLIKKHVPGDFTREDLFLLDVGCGEGHFILEAQKYGLRCEGLEPSKSHSPKKGLNLRIFNGFLKNFKQKRRYDIVTLLDVLEHTREPLDEIKMVRKIIKKDGILVMRVPNLRWLMMKEKLFRAIAFLMGINTLKLNSQGIYSPHTHLYTFSEKSIIKLLSLGGFELSNFEIINASSSTNLFKNLFYSIYYNIVRFIFVLSGINLAISLNIVAKPK